MIPKKQIDDLDDVFDIQDALLDELEDEDFEDPYGKGYVPNLEHTDRWDTRNYNPTDWEIYLKELGTQGY
jgi:hypothetical protein